MTRQVRVYPEAMRRALVSVRAPEAELGAIVVDGNFVDWQGGAPDVMRGLIADLGPDDAARMVMTEGWANGAGLYLAEAVPGR